MKHITQIDRPELVALRIERLSRPAGGGCREWTARIDRWGYGLTKVHTDGVYRQTGAHRAAWLALRGAIPEGLVIDHTCRNRACVNIAHLRLVTPATNTLIGDHSRKKGRSGHRRGTVLHSCQRHGREDGYERLGRDGYVRWMCRECVRNRKAKMLASRSTP